MATVIYDLECEYGHRFEGWFRSLEDFEKQREQSLLCCPDCQTVAIRKIPSKLNIGASAGSRPNVNGASSYTAESANTADKASEMPPASASEEMKVATAFVMAKQVMNALIRHSEDVGDSFAEEARKIYYEEAPARAIRGSASHEEFEELRDEGIDIIALPSIPLDDELN